jgi:RNA polymerase sigma-70 factor (ECF subfamily)
VTREGAFLAEWNGVEPVPGLEAVLEAACARARQAYREVELDDERFCGYLGARTPTETAPALAIERLCLEDLYLACACVHGIRAALQIFDERLLSRTRAYLARLGPDAELVDEARQALRARLFVAADGAPPRITQYSGRGPLDAWVRVSAMRVALNLIDARSRHPPTVVLDEEMLPAGGDLELDYVRERYRATFLGALKRAIAELPPAERAILRFHFVDGLTPGHIGEIYGVHRTTTLRRIAASKNQLLERTRAHIMEELQLSPDDCDSLVGLLRSRLRMTLSSLFRSGRL